MEYLKPKDFDLINELLSNGKDVKIRPTSKGAVILEIASKTVKKIEIKSDKA